MSGEGKSINILTALVSLGVDEKSAARVVQGVTKDANAIQAKLDKLNSKNAQKAMGQWADAVQRAGGVQALTSAQTLRLAADIEKLSKAGATVPAALQPAINALEKLRAAEKAAAEQAAHLATAQKDKGDLQKGLMDKVGLGGLVGAGAGAGAVVGLGIAAGAAKETFELIKASAELADEISDMSKTYQVSTGEIQTWRAMARGAGIDAKAYGESLINVQKNLTNNAEKFKAWGMDVEALRALKPDELLGAMSDKLRSLNENDRLTFIEDFKIAGEIVPDLLDDFDALREAAAGSINPLNENEIENLKATKDAITEMGGAWTDMWTEIGNALGSDEQIRSFFQSIADGLKDLVKLIADNRETIADFAKFLVAAADQTGLASAYQNVRALQKMVAGPDTHQLPGLGGSVPWLQAGVASGAPLSGLGAPGYTVPGSIKMDLAAREAAQKKAAADAKAAAAEEKRTWMEANAEIVSDLNDRNKEYARHYKERTDAALAETERLLKVMREDAPRLQGEQDSAEWGWTSDFMKKKYVADLFADEESASLAFGPKESRIEKEKKATVEWSALLNDVANQLTSMGQTGTAIGKVLGGITGIGAMFGNGGALDGVTGVKSLLKGGTGGDVLKSLTGGLSAAFAAFDLGKSLFNMLHKTEAQKVAFDIGRDYGVQISEGLSKEIASKSKTMGRDAASLLSLDKIVGEAGGVQKFGLDKTISKLHDLFSMTATGKLTMEQARGPFDALFGDVAQASISKTTGLISSQARELMSFAIDGGMGSDAVKKFQGEQVDKTTSFLDRLTKNKDFKVAGAAAGEFLGGALADAYNKALESGMSSAEIAEQLGPQIDALQKKLDEAGVSGGAVFAGMTKDLALFTNEITGPAASAFEDLIGMTASMYNSGTLNSTNFKGLAQQLGATYQQTVAKGTEAGMSEQDVFDALAPKLQKVWEAQQRLGVTLDPETQALIDRALGEGKIGTEFMDPMLAEQQRTNEILESIARGMGADVPGRKVPTDLGSYTGGAPSDIGKALADAIAQGGITGGEAGVATGEAVASAISGLAAAISGFTSQPININTKVQLDGGPIVGMVADAIDRNGSAEARKLNAALNNRDDS